MLTLRLFQLKPPNYLVITTDDLGSDWYQLGEASLKYPKRDGIDASIMTSEGSIQNAERLVEAGGKVNVGYVLAPALDTATTDKLYSLGSVDYEPVWIFYRKSPTIQINQLKDLKNYNIGIGPPTGGTYVLTKKLMALNDIDVDKEKNFISDKRSKNMVRLKNGEIDGIIMIGAVIDPIVRQLMHDPDFELFNFRNAKAYPHLISYYTTITIPEGSIDLVKILPTKDIELIAVTSTLAVRRDVHPGAQLALLSTAIQQRMRVSS